MSCMWMVTTDRKSSSRTTFEIAPKIKIENKDSSILNPFSVSFCTKCIFVKKKIPCVLFPFTKWNQTGEKSTSLEVRCKQARTKSERNRFSAMAGESSPPRWAILSHEPGQIHQQKKLKASARKGIFNASHSEETHNLVIKVLGNTFSLFAGVMNLLDNLLEFLWVPLLKIFACMLKDKLINSIQMCL